MSNRAVTMDEVLDLVAYEKERPAIRAKMMEMKRPRRIAVGEHLTFLFENHDTVLYQVHEMMRAERMVHDDAIQHELDTYNGLLPSSPGALAVVLLVEYATAEEREEHLPNLLTLNEHLEIQVGDQPPVSPRWDAMQVGDTRISSVQYLQFLDVAPDEDAIAAFREGPVVLRSTHPYLSAETVLEDASRAALADDMA